MPCHYTFDVRFRLFTEGRYRPALTLGLQDFVGTGIYAAEYLVATKTLTPALRVTGGIGWGRLAGVDSFTNPLGLIDDSFETREARDGNLGGEVELGEAFHGPAALFGGLEWQATDTLKFTLEYSSDDYPYEGESSFEYRSPVNVGVSYRPRPDLELSARYLYGSQLGLQASFFVDPTAARAPSGLEKAPPPVAVRSAAELGWPQDTSWAAAPARRAGDQCRRHAPATDQPYAAINQPSRACSIRQRLDRRRSNRKHLVGLNDAVDRRRTLLRERAFGERRRRRRFRDSCASIRCYSVYLYCELGS
mgnify:CR=1 FL=1